MANRELKAALREYVKVRNNYINALHKKGIEFEEPHAEDEEISKLRNELRDRGANFRNAGASISVGWLSEACVECTGERGSETFSTTLACHRDCYFCFNHNLGEYERFSKEGCPWEQNLEEAVDTHRDLACIGLTGGEPLLAFDDTIKFLERAEELFPGSHKRLYTSGDLLDAEKAEKLAEAGLDEIRFSVKTDDPEDLQEKVLSNMSLAKNYIQDVMVEMPIIPGTSEKMKWLLGEFDGIGIRGMNLLEFCFPFHNWEEYASRGFLIRNPPFDIMYDYSYSGGLPVAGSEVLALELMLYAMDEGYDFGMHYCSLDNKHRSEMRQKNSPGAHIHPCYVLDEGDFFLKTAKVFGEDREKVSLFLGAMGCNSILENENDKSTCFPPRFADAVRGNGVDVAMSVNVLETDEVGRGILEVGLEPLA
ncbi:MAG: radical SAM protein [Coriobacteriales bacterium]|jgi:pyruvate formate-lyase activating enzyme-like uncharacterized protein